MNILGCILFLLVGTIIIISIPKILKYKEKDYSQFPITTGTVYHTHDFLGDRWIVGFVDENGKEVLGMDDIISYSTFSQNKYNIPKFGSKEKIYYWKHEYKSQYYINDKRVEYYIHFCNEDFYNLQRIKRKNHSNFAIILGLVFIICGILIGLY